MRPGTVLAFRHAWRSPFPAAAVFDGISFMIALRQFRRESQRGQSFWRAVRGSKDPTTFTVLAEDSAALAGLAIAATGVWASHRLGMPRLDGAASMLIGLLLAGVAVLLIHQSRSLLVGEGIRPETAQRVRELALSHDEIERVAATVAALEREVHERFPSIRHIYVEAALLVRQPPPRG